MCELCAWLFQCCMHVIGTVVNICSYHGLVAIAAIALFFTVAFAKEDKKENEVGTCIDR